MNKIIFTGNLGGDPELRYTPAGQAVVKMSVASNRQYTTSDGNTVQEVTWYRVTAWGKLAEACSQYLKKGNKVLIEGRLTPDPSSGGPRIWIGKEGQPMATFEVNAERIEFLSYPKDALPDVGDADSEEDLPF